MLYHKSTNQPPPSNPFTHINHNSLSSFVSAEPSPSCIVVESPSRSCRNAEWVGREFHRGSAKTATSWPCRGSSRGCLHCSLMSRDFRLSHSLSPFRSPVWSFHIFVYESTPSAGDGESEAVREKFIWHLTAEGAHGLLVINVANIGRSPGRPYDILPP